MQPGTLRGAPPPLAGNNFKIVTLQRAHNDGLDDPALSNRIGKLVEFGFCEQPARIARIRAQVFDWRTTRLTACVGSRRLLADIAHKTIPELPYGRQRLVELAITLGLKPQVLLLDEPAAGVPSAESHIILDAIDALPKSIGVLIIDHDMDLVFRFAKRITVMVRGAVFAEGTPREIGANAEVRAVYLGQAAHGS